MTIVSHKYKYIFIRCRKTASTSMETWLSSATGERDVITPFGPHGELRRKEYGGRAPQNWQQADGTMLFDRHMPAADVRRVVGEDVWDSYFTWCFDRSPYEKVISMWSFLHHGDSGPTLDEFIRSGEAAVTANSDLYTIDGRTAVDFVGRFEDLMNELGEVVDRVGLPLDPVRLPRAKARFRTDRRKALDILTPDQTARVDDIFRADFEAQREARGLRGRG